MEAIDVSTITMTTTKKKEKKRRKDATMLFVCHQTERRQDVPHPRRELNRAIYCSLFRPLCTWGVSHLDLFAPAPLRILDVPLVIWGELPKTTHARNFGRNTPNNVK